MKKAKKSPMESYLESHPYLAETAALYLELEARLKEVATPIALPAREELIALAQKGTPLLQKGSLRQLIVKAAAEALPAALARLADLPAPALMQDALKAWGEWAKAAKKTEIKKVFDALVRQEDEQIRDFAARTKLSEPVLRTIGWALLSALVPEDVKAAALWEEAKWDANTCPVCGRPPVMAQLRKEKEGRARFLSCDGCHTVWPYARIGCAYCGNKDLRKMHILEPEGEESMRLDVCDECRAYLKTYQREGEEDVYLHDWATIHLDMLGEEKGLHTEGSVLSARE